jgi:hypothetical protein
MNAFNAENDQINGKFDFIIHLYFFYPTDHCTTIYGEWFGETAAGFQNKINNPRYMFELSDEGEYNMISL